MTALPLLAGLRQTRASDHLNMVRGVAAVLVLLYHVRYRFFLDYADIREASPLATAWYVITAFGHDAVMIFFVVSGLLIGAAVLRENRRETWRWTPYLTARAVRLYVVLLPALLLTCVWDQLGMAWFGELPIYTGAPAAYRHDYFDVAARADTSTFLANVAFLQGIVAQPFGSNEALWSLSYEFWYYIAFPLVVLAIRPRQTTRHRMLYLAVAAGVLTLMSSSMLAYFPIWLMGAGVSLLPRSARIGEHPRPWLWTMTLVFGAWLVASHTSFLRDLLNVSVLGTDYLTGVGFSALLYVVLHDGRAASSATYGRVASALADSSYTLYLVHLPVLVAVRAWITAAPWTPTPLTIAVGLFLAIAVLCYALVIAALTEAHTQRLRRAVDGWLEQRSSPPPTAPVIASASGPSRPDIVRSREHTTAGP